MEYNVTGVVALVFIFAFEQKKSSKLHISRSAEKKLRRGCDSRQSINFLTALSNAAQCDTSRQIPTITNVEVIWAPGPGQIATGTQ
jgi:hypothetical protein